MERPSPSAVYSSLKGKVVLVTGGASGIGEAIARVRPSAVDVASGVESSPGVKDQRKMKSFFEAVHRADALLSR